MQVLTYDTRRYFLFSVRMFFGIWLLYAGMFKWLAIGSTGFVGYIASDFDKTWSPHMLNVVLAWLIMISEPLLAAWLLIGKQQRLAWALTSLLMFMLVLGQSILMKPEVIANWQYLVLTIVCAALSDPIAGKR